MKLTHAGTELSAETLRNPPVVICNYVFDTLTQDAFRVKDGSIGQGMVTVKSAEPDADTREDGSFTHDLIRHMRCEWTFEDVDLSQRARARRLPPRVPCAHTLPPTRQRSMAMRTLTRSCGRTPSWSRGRC